MQTPSGWRCLKGGVTTFIMKRSFGSNIFKVVVSDMVYVWLREVSTEELADIIQDLNPLIECDDHSTVLKIWSLLEEEEESKSVSCDVQVIDDQALELRFRTKVDSLAFKLYLELRRGTPREYFEEITLHLMSAAEELFARQNLLCNLLEKKDLEIDQYKLEGAKLSRQNVETPKFCEVNFGKKPHTLKCTLQPLERILKVLQLNFLSNEKVLKEDTDTNVNPRDGQQGDNHPSFSESSCFKTDVECVKAAGVNEEATESREKEAPQRILKKKKVKLNL